MMKIKFNSITFSAYDGTKFLLNNCKAETAEQLTKKEINTIETLIDEQNKIDNYFFKNSSLIAKLSIHN